MFNHICFFHLILHLIYLIISISKFLLVTIEISTSCPFTVEVSVLSGDTSSLWYMMTDSPNEYWWKGLSIGHNNKY